MLLRFCLRIAVLPALLPLYSDTLNDDLFAAVRKSNVAAVRDLLSKGADVNAKTSYGQTPLFFAADRGNVEIVRMLLDKGADVNTVDTFYKSTPLTWAATKGQTEVVKMLLAKGASDVAGVLTSGIDDDKPDLVKAALETGRLKPDELTRALALAEHQKKPQFAQMLKDAGAKPRAEATAQVPPDVLATYAGKYLGGRGGTEMEMQVKAEGGKLILVNGSNLLTLAAIDRTHFRGVEFDQVEIEFLKREDAVTGLAVLQGGGRSEFKRVETK